MKPKGKTRCRLCLAPIEGWPPLRWVTGGHYVPVCKRCFRKLREQGEEVRVTALLE